MAKIGLFTGSFDPVTNGHLDIIARASKLFDTLFVGIFYNKAKNGFFSVEERRQMLEEALQEFPNVKVITARDSLVVDIAKRLEVGYLVRGLRNGKDLEYEADLAFYNHYLALEIESVFLLSSPDLVHVSSSRIRELIYFHSDISDFVPTSVVKKWRKNMAILKRFKEILKKLGRILYRFKWWILGVVGIVFLLFSLLYPLDYYIEMPGGAYDIRSVLTVDNKEDDEDGSYNFVAVTVSQATLAQLVYAWLTPYTEISTAADVTGGYSNADYLRINEYYMETSQNTATYQALTLAGKEATLDYQGVYVLNVSDNSTFKGILNIADTVTGVNGQTFNSSAELMGYVADLDLGSEVTVQYTSDGEAKEATGKIIELSNGKMVSESVW